MANKNQPIGYAEDSQIEAWKSQYNLKRVHEILTTDEEGNEHVTYSRKPNLEMLQMLADHAKKNQEFKGLEVMFNTLRLGGSDEVMKDDEMKLAAMGAVGKLFRKQEAKVKKR